MTEDFTHDRPGTPAAAWADDPRTVGLPPLDLAAPERVERVVVATAHPDDESLGAGGLVARLHRLGVPVRLLVATAGEGSHPRSPTVTPDRLAAMRRYEAAAAWAALGGRPEDLEVGDLPDGGLADREDELVGRLVAAVGDGRRTTIVSTWEHDGHPDHEAVGRAARVAAWRTGARVVAFPVWFWHRGRPDDAPWGSLRVLALDEGERAAKAAAIAAHASQVGPLSDRPGDETLLGADLLAHFRGPTERFVEVEPADDAFDRLHEDDADPWGTHSRWYEERKRALVAAVLPRRRFDRALDVGCSTGTMTTAIADRCDRVVAVDPSQPAVEAAREALADHPGVEVHRMDTPWEWPEGRWDLVLVSESAYFLSPVALDELLVRIGASLTPDGCIVFAHWRHPIAGWPLSGPDVHAVVERTAGSGGLPPVAARYADPDVEILLLARQAVLPDPAGD